MVQNSVNSFFELLSAIPAQDMYVVLCVQVTPQKEYKILATTNDDKGAWSLVDPTAQPVLNANEFFTAASDVDMVMADRPITAKGYTYILLIRMSCTMNQIQRTALLNRLIERHNTAVVVAPQPDVVELLKTVAADTERVGVWYSIHFKQKLYTMLSYRFGSDPEESYNIMLDPLAFDAALHATGWCMPDCPAHTERVSVREGEDGIPQMVKDVYYAMLVRPTANQGPTYLISSPTDVQDYRKRQDGINAHFRRQLASVV